MSRLILWQQMQAKGNNWATKISNKVQLGNKYEKKVNL
jgi:hypothetical protein